MYLFYRNLETHKVKIEHEVAKLGGGYSILERLKMGGNGVGGVKYMGGLSEIDKIRTYEDTIICNFELLKKTFAIRFRNIEFHSYLVLDLEEIQHIKLTKEADEIHFSKRSLFQWLLKKGVTYETARIVAPPRELVKIGKVKIEIKMQNKTLHFENLDGFSGKFSKYFRHPFFRTVYLEEIKHFNVKQYGSLGNTE